MCGILEELWCREEASAEEHLPSPFILNQPLGAYTSSLAHSLTYSALPPLALHSFVQDLFVGCLLIATAEDYQLGVEWRPAPFLCGVCTCERGAVSIQSVNWQ